MSKFGVPYSYLIYTLMSQNLFIGNSSKTKTICQQSNTHCAYMLERLNPSYAYECSNNKTCRFRNILQTYGVNDVKRKV